MATRAVRVEICRDRQRERRPAYREHWPLFHKAIKEKYPEIILIANHWLGGYPSDPMPEVVDEHYCNREFARRTDQGGAQTRLARVRGRRIRHAFPANPFTLIRLRGSGKCRFPDATEKCFAPFHAESAQFCLEFSASSPLCQIISGFATRQCGFYGE